MLTTEELRSLAADRIEEMRADAARERLAHGFRDVGVRGRGLRHAIGRALIAFGLIVDGDGGSSAGTATLPRARRPNPCDEKPVLPRVA